jgi:hypothetical protein
MHLDSEFSLKDFLYRNIYALFKAKINGKAHKYYGKRYFYI